MSESVELEGFISSLRTSHDAVGNEQVDNVELVGVPTQSGKAELLRQFQCRGISNWRRRTREW